MWEEDSLTNSEITEHQYVKSWVEQGYLKIDEVIGFFTGKKSFEDIKTLANVRYRESH